MEVKICAAYNCNNPVIGGSVKRLYCSDRCRYRENKRAVTRNRAAKGLCVQCGGEYDAPVGKHRKKSTPQYCSKCQEYYANHYKERRSHEQ